MKFRGRGMIRREQGGGISTSVGSYGSSISPHHPFSSTLSRKRKSSTPISLSLSSHHNDPFSIWDDSDWVSVENDASAARGFCGRFIGPAPSESEVDDVVSSLQRVLGPASRVQLLWDCNKSDNELCHVGQVSEDDLEANWAEPYSFPYNSNMLQANGSDRVYYAIHLLQTDPSVKRLVKSLSTDEAVWEAVLNNEVVQEFRESISADQEQVLQNLDGIANDDLHNTRNALMWILNIASAKFMEVIEKITRIVIDLFQHAFNNTVVHSETFHEKLRTSFMLSIIILLIVVVSRVRSYGTT